MIEILGVYAVLDPDLRADRIGSLYLNNSGVAGCSPAVVTNTSQDTVDLVKSRYSVGPITRREFWEKERSTMQQHHGPCERTHPIHTKLNADTNCRVVCHRLPNLHRKPRNLMDHHPRNLPSPDPKTLAVRKLSAR